MQQTSLTVTPTHTSYAFTGGGVVVELSFFTPAFLNDLDVLSRPVTYLTWTVRSADAASHKVDVLLDASPEIATSMAGQQVTFARHHTDRTEVLSVGTRDQNVLNRSGDDLRIDWGYFHIAVPKDEAAQTAIGVGGMSAFAKGETLPAADTMDGPVVDNRSAPHLDAALSLGMVGATPVARHLLVSYTEQYAIQLFQRNLRPYWQRNNMPVSEMLDTAEQSFTSLEQRGIKFDHDLTSDLTTEAGAHYAYICTVAYRQAIAAHKLVADVDGRPMLFGKENFSNGDISTVDVMYPSAPIFLFFNPALLEAQILPVLEYAAMPNRWHFPFAPHDLGQYPLANGQEYGGGEKTEEDQMPVEESGNLLLLLDALAQKQGNADLAAKYWPQLTQWAGYLREHGLDPENQLTTDDFAGHVAHNSNLSVKAIEGLAAYADLARMLHHPAEAKQNSETAKGMAGKWIDMAREGDHYKLAFNSPGTWSQKYNLVWDDVLRFHLFPESVRRSEVAYYQTKLNRYGLPLDSRADYTKLDWEIWTSTLARDKPSFDAIVDPIYSWIGATTSRVPMTDWYDTKTGKQVGFQARSGLPGLLYQVKS